MHPQKTEKGLTMKKYPAAALLAILGSLSNAVHAQANDCSSYPISEGMSIEEVDGGLKILSTASADVLFDDRTEVQSALREAQLYAEAAIAEFLNKQIQSEDSLETTVNTQVTVVGEAKELNQERLKVQLRSIRTEASALLSGVAPLGNCYTSGEYVMFTVGVKPSTVAGAAQLGGDMASSASSQKNVAGSTSGQASANSSSSVQPETSGSSATVDMKAVKGFSNTGNLSDF